MQYTQSKALNRDLDEPLHGALEQLIREMGMSLIELDVFHRKGRDSGVQVRAVILAKEKTSLEECSRVHHAIFPRLELAFPGKDIGLEVSSPGIDRLIKEGREFSHYLGRGVRCYRTDISDWTTGTLIASDDEKIVLDTENGELALSYEEIAKARLDGASGLTKKETRNSGV